MGTIKITRKMIKTIPTYLGEADVIKDPANPTQAYQPERND
jgi:hypothetical protein